MNEVVEASILHDTLLDELEEGDILGSAKAAVAFGLQFLKDDDDSGTVEMTIIEVKMYKENRGEDWKNLFVEKGDTSGLLADAPDDMDDMVRDRNFLRVANEVKDDVEEAQRKAEIEAQDEAIMRLQRQRETADEKERQKQEAERQRLRYLSSRQSVLSKYWLAAMVLGLSFIAGIFILFQ